MEMIEDGNKEDEEEEHDKEGTETANDDSWNVSIERGHAFTRNQIKRLIGFLTRSQGKEP